MLGSQLLYKHPFFRGADFGIDELAVFGLCQFREAVLTPDTWQRHAGTEIVFVLDGETCWEFPEERMIQVSGGHALVFPPGVAHRVANGIYPRSRTFWMVFHPPAAAPRVGAMFPARELDDLLSAADHVQTPLKLDGDGLRTIGDLARRLRDERVFTCSSLMKAEIRCALYATLVSFWKGCAQRARPARADDMVTSYVHRIRETLHEDGPVFAPDAACGRSRFYALFRRQLGMPPNDYRQRLRIKRCCQQLSSTDLSVTEIAMAHGFNSTQYFARVFRKYVGITPSRYRSLFSEGEALDLPLLCRGDEVSAGSNLAAKAAPPIPA
jgi:AraC-like DNA-binding protein